MKRIVRISFMLLLIALPMGSYGQGYISYDYMPASTLRDEIGNKYGSGELQILSAGYNLPLSVKQNDRGQMIAWSATIRGTYGILNNEGPAKDLNPDNILNTSLNITHMRPISEKWSIIASIGGGVYAPLYEISTKSILANGAIIFVYRLGKNLDLGVGAGLTNSYGIPMALPMLYFSWRSTSKYEFKIEMASSMKISATTRLNKKIKVEFAAIDIDGMAAVRKIDGKSKIYSTVMLKSYISPSFQLSKQTNFYVGIGGNWLRGISISDRSLKGFINSFKEKDDNKEFTVALRFMTGFRYRF